MDNFRSIHTLALLGALVIGLALSACGDKQQPTADAASKPGAAGPAAAAKPMGLPVKAVPVKVGLVQDEITAVGSLLAEESVIIRPEIDGRVVDIHFAEGQRVAKGARLVSLDPAEYRAQLAQAEAQARTDAQRHERSKELLAQNFISEEAVDVAKNSLDRTEAQAREAQARLSKATIVAPFSGTVGLRLISPGAYVKAGDDIVRLENIDSIKVDFRIPELYAAQVRPDQHVAIRLDAFPGEAFEGRIYAIEPVVEERTRTILLRARVPNRGFKLKPGMFVRVALTLGERKSAILVPEPAIWPQGQDNFVYRVVDGKAALTKISLGVRRPGEVEVTQGLTPEDVVVTEGQIKLKDGAPVMVMGAAGPTATAGATPAGGSAGGAVSGAVKPGAGGSKGTSTVSAEKAGG